MATHVGLELSSAEARILEAEGTAKKLKITNFVRVELEPPKEGPAAAILDKDAGDRIDKALSASKISRDPVAMSWDSGLTIFREMELPFTSDEQIRKVIKYEAESHLLNCDINDVVVCHYKLVEGKEKSRLMVMAANKEQLLNRLEVVGRAGVDPQIVDLDVMAAFNALSALGYVNEHKTFMVLDCGRRLTQALLITDGRLISGRAIRIGSDQITTRLAHDLETDPAMIAGQAKRLLGNPDTSDDLLVPAASVTPAESKEEKAETAKAPVELARDLAMQRVGDFYGKLAREVRRTLITQKLPNPIEVVYATGPGSLLPGFAENVAQKLGINAPVKPLALFERVEHTLKPDHAKQVEAEALTALGLAFKSAGYDSTNVDFRQEEVRYTKKFDQVKEPLIYFCAVALLFVLLWDMMDVKRLSTKQPFLIQVAKSDMYKIHDAAMQVYTKALGTDAPITPAMKEPSLVGVNAIKRQMDSKIEELKAELGRGGTITKLPSAFVMWQDVFSAIQPEMGRIGKLVIEDIRVVVRKQKNPYCELKGYTSSPAAYNDLITALKTIRAPKEVPNGEPELVPVTVKEGNTKNPGDRYEFVGLRIEWPERLPGSF